MRFLLETVQNTAMKHRISRDERNVFVGRDSSVRIATRYGLDGPGIQSPQRRDFPLPSTPDPGPTQPPIQWVPGLSRG